MWGNLCESCNVDKFLSLAKVFAWASHARGSAWPGLHFKFSLTLNRLFEPLIIIVMIMIMLMLMVMAMVMSADEAT